MRTLQNVHVLRYDEFDAIVAANFEWDPSYEFVAEMESNNDTDYLYEDILKVPKYPWEQKEIDEFIAGDRQYVNPSTILSALVQLDVLPEGHYVIEVSW